MITFQIQNRWGVFLRAGLAVMLLSASWAQAQTQWPSKTVTLVVPFAPGGGTDIGSRIVAQKLSQLWGQSELVDNRGGAEGFWVTFGLLISLRYYTVDRYWQVKKGAN